MNIIGKSKQIKEVLCNAEKVATSDATVLITGETGTGKELIAHFIYENSLRKDKPLIILNCAAIAETLIEDELFGHEKHSFTGAYNRRIGKFEQTDGGTLFLDEIGDMSLSVQAKILRVLEDGKFYRIGGTELMYSDVRIISATNKSLIENDNFRDDLYYRLNIVNIHIPPLRERKEDIFMIAEYYLNYFGYNYTIPDSMLNRMFLYSWPGNVRELKSVIQKFVVMGESVKFEDKYGVIKSELTYEKAVNDFRARFLKEAIEKNDGNLSKTAAILDIQRTYLSRLITKFNLRGKK